MILRTPHARDFPRHHAQLKFKVVVNCAHVVKVGEETRNNNVVERHRLQKRLATADVFPGAEVAGGLDVARGVSKDCAESRVVFQNSLAERVRIARLQVSNAFKPAVEECLVPLDEVVFFANLAHAVVVAALPFGFLRFALELDCLFGGRRPAVAAVLQFTGLQDVFQRRNADFRLQLRVFGGGIKHARNGTEEVFVIVDEHVSELFGPLLKGVADFLHDAIHDDVKRVSVFAQEVLVCLGVELCKFAPFGREDLDELANANGRTLDEAALGDAEAFEGDADGGEDVLVDGPVKRVDGGEDVVGAVLVAAKRRQGCEQAGGGRAGFDAEHTKARTLAGCRRR